MILFSWHREAYTWAPLPRPLGALAIHKKFSGVLASQPAPGLRGSPLGQEGPFRWLDEFFALGAIL
jgi:hypothetical protein